MHRAIPILLASVCLCAGSTSVDAQDRRQALPAETVSMAGAKAPARIATPDVVFRPQRGRTGASHARHGAYVPGDTLTFNVPLILAGGWGQAHFTLVAASDTVRLWVATDEWDTGPITQRVVDSLMVTIHSRTPANSYDPSAGVFEISKTIFGETSNIGGDGMVDVLLYDIVDGYVTPGSAFTPVAVALDDIDPNAPPGAGNQRDMIYLDTFPSLTADDGSVDPEDIDFVRGSLAGGFQALIHMNQDPEETAFFRIGLFEWAKELSGFPGQPTTYLQFEESHRIQLDLYEGFLEDRQRSAHFIRYAADQFGAEIVGGFAQDSASGISGLKNMLSSAPGSRSMADFVADFHVANFVNDTTLGRAYGFADARHADINAEPTLLLDGSLNISPPPGGVQMGAGGVHYVTWDNVRELEVRADALDPVNRVDFRVHAFIESVDGSNTLETLDATSTLQRIGGSNDRVTIVLIHSNLEEPSATGVVTGEWAGTAYPTVNVVRDDGQYFDAAAPNFVQLGHGWTQAVRFEPPSGMALYRLYVPPLYINQFVDPATGGLFGSPQDPRDFRVVVMSEAAPGVPGDTLLTRDIVDPRPYSLRTSRAVEFINVDLRDAPTLALGETAIYVGLTEAGADRNTLILGMASHANSDVSFIHGPVGGPPASWRSLWSLTSGGESLSGYSIPIRGQFRSQTAVGLDPSARRAGDIEIVSVYPNPVHESARLIYRGARPGTYNARIFDLLGREVRRVEVAATSSGTATLDLDVRMLASGVYFVSLSDGTAIAKGAMQPLVVAR